MEFIKAKTEILLNEEELNVLKTAQSILHEIFWEMEPEDTLIDKYDTEYSEEEVNLAQTILSSLANANCSIRNDE